MFRFTLNGTILSDEPEGINEFQEAIVRNEDLRGITFEYVGDLTFRGDGYKIIADAWQEGFCDYLPLVIEQDCGGGVFEEVATLRVVLSDIDENLEKCEVSVSPIDNSYYALIHNNRDLKVDMRSTKTKSGESMTACDTVDVSFFLPELNSGDVDYEADTRQCYEHKAALEHVLTYITDGEIDTVESDYLDELYWSLPQQPDPTMYDCESFDAVIVTGLAMSDLNGIYERNGDYNGQPFYLQEGATGEVGGLPVPSFVLTVFTESPYLAQWSLIYDSGAISASNSTTPENPWDATWPSGTFEQYCPNPEIVDSSFCLLTGVELRQHTGDAVAVSFKDLLQTLFATHNLFWAIEGGTFRIEPFSYWLGDNGQNITKIVDLKRSVDTSKLYSLIKVGSETNVIDRDLVYSLPNYKLSAHAVQEYHLSGQCNTESQLNLISPLVYDSNTIEKVIVTQNANEAAGDDPDTTYDENIFYVQYGTDSLGNNIAVYDTSFLLPTSPPKGVVYNPFLFNNRVLARHTYHSDIVVYEGDEDDIVKATATDPDSTVTYINYSWATTTLSPAQQSALNSLFGGAYPSGLPQTFEWGGETFPPVQFDNDSTDGNYDPNGNWSTTDYWYEAPENGVYGFNFAVAIKKVYDKVMLIGDTTFIDTNTHPNPNQYYLQSIVPCRFRLYMDVIDDSGDLYNTIPLYVEIVEDSYYNEISGTLAQYDSVIFSAPDTNGFQLQNVFNTGTGGLGDGYTAVQAQNIVGESGKLNQIAVPTPQSRINGVVYLESGWRMRLRVDIFAQQYFPNPATDEQRQVRFGVAEDSFVETTFVQTGGGIVPGYSNDEHAAIQYICDHPMTLASWKALKENPRMAIGLSTKQLEIVDTYFSRISRNFETGEASIDNITTRSRL